MLWSLMLQEQSSTCWLEDGGVRAAEVGRLVLPHRGLGWRIKCNVIHAGKHNPQFGYVWGGGDLGVTEAEKDVGVMVTSNLKPSV